MHRPSHDRASLVKAVTEGLSLGIGKPITLKLAEALGARTSLLVGADLLSENDVIMALTGPLWLGRELDIALIGERANNIAHVAYLRAEELAA